VIIRWKNKNPFINMYRELGKVISNNETLEQKQKDIQFILNKNYSGNWLHSYPIFGNEIPKQGEDLSKNPYYSLYQKLNSLDTTLLSKELAWMEVTPRLEDWIYVE
jgi:hypothetical protein